MTLLGFALPWTCVYSSIKPEQVMVVQSSHQCDIYISAVLLVLVDKAPWFVERKEALSLKTKKKKKDRKTAGPVSAGQIFLIGLFWDKSLLLHLCFSSLLLCIFLLKDQNIFIS